MGRWGAMAPRQRDVMVVPIDEYLQKVRVRNATHAEDALGQVPVAFVADDNEPDDDPPPTLRMAA